MSYGLSPYRIDAVALKSIQHAPHQYRYQYQNPRQEQSDDEDHVGAECPLSPGDMVSGVVSSNQHVDGMVVMDLTASISPTSSPGGSSSSSSSKKSKEQKKATARGVLPHPHLGDHASVCVETLAAALTPGTTVQDLLVLEVDKMGVPTVSLKPLLVAASTSTSAKGEPEEGDGDGRKSFIPKSASDVAVGDLLAGYVSRVESFGVFVKFLGRFTALCPRSMAADRVVEDPSGMFTEGDSVR